MRSLLTVASWDPMFIDSQCLPYQRCLLYEAKYGFTNCQPQNSIWDLTLKLGSRIIMSCKRFCQSDYVAMSFATLLSSNYALISVLPHCFQCPFTAMSDWNLVINSVYDVQEGTDSCSDYPSFAGSAWPTEIKSIKNLFFCH